ncbi:MAG: hypothetical protein KZQ58_09910 [gamma proteobacterium symbiont of Bathyaustriella thionipta]|nr:hypothetical protein [gamma proteobacterium symbiont of Bathyaustriella thionipta]
MATDLYDVYFKGQLLPDADPDKARQHVARLVKANDKQIKALFAGKPVRIKKNIDLDKAAKIRLAFRDAGALIEIRDAEIIAKKDSEKAPDAPEIFHSIIDMQHWKPTALIDAESTTVTVFPPFTGSLEEFARHATAPVIPDISAIELAPIGEDLDDTAEPATFEIDLDGLEMLPANTGDLSDCIIKTEVSLKSKST